MKFLSITLRSCKTKKASIENNRRKFGDTTGKRKQYDSDEESASSGEEKEEEEEEEAEEEEEEEEYEVEGESTKKEDCSKNEVFSKLPRTFKKLLLLHLQKDN